MCESYDHRRSARCNCEHRCSARCNSAKSWLLSRLLHSSMAIDAVKEMLCAEVAEHVSYACLRISSLRQVMKTMHVRQHAVKEDAGWCNAILGESFCTVAWTRTLAFTLGLLGLLYRTVICSR